MGVAYKMLKNIVSPFIGKGLGRYKLLSWPYHQLVRSIMPNKDRIVELDGYKLKVSLRNNKLDGIAQQLVFTNRYEPGTTQVIKNYVKEGMTVIDVGANIGYFTYLMSKLVGENGRVLAFEPEPDNYYRLSENWVLNKAHNVELSNLAVSNTNGYAYLNISNKESGEHSLEEKTREYLKRIRINTTKLDSYATEVGLIKIDVEGHEAKVIDGARKLLESNKDVKLIIEFWPEGLAKIEPSEPYRIFPILNSLGFKYIYLIHEFDGSIAKTSIRDTLRYCERIKFSVNLLCSRSGYVKS